MYIDDVTTQHQCASKSGSPVKLYKIDKTAPAAKHQLDGSCQGLNQRWSVNSGNGTITNVFNGKCLDVNEWTGPLVDV